MKARTKYQINKNYITKKKEINYYKNKIIDIEFLKNYLDPMLKNKKALEENLPINNPESN